MVGIKLTFRTPSGRQLTWTGQSANLGADGVLELKDGNRLLLLGPDDHDGPVLITGGQL